jgi:predicted O-methyltransferase YrrM
MSNIGKLISGSTYKFRSYHTNKGDYFKSLIKKHFDISHSLTHINFTKKTNEILFDELSNDKVFAIHFNDSKLDIDDIKIPIYPILVFDKKDNFTLIVTPIILQQIRLLPSDGSLVKLISNISHFMGGLMTNKLQNVNLTRQTLYNGFNDCPKCTPICKNINITQLINNKLTTLFNENEHGWLGETSQLNLEYVIKTFKPKTVVEFGSWMGKSANFMTSLDENIDLFCLDTFPNLCHTTYMLDDYHPINKFYTNVPRFETFYRNLSKVRKGKTYMMRSIRCVTGDFAFNILRKHNINIDMIYIDFAKKTHVLLNLLETIRKLYPKCIIVGDDYIVKTVRIALSLFVKKHKDLHIRSSYGSYIVSPKELIGYDKIAKLGDRANMESKSIVSGINLNKYNYYLHAQALLHKNRIRDAYNFITQNKLDMNALRAGSYCQDCTVSTYYTNTLYHILALTIREKHSKNVDVILEPFVKYQKPKTVRNVLLLTWYDYLEFPIEL